MQIKTVTNCNVEPMKRKRLWSFGGVGLNSTLSVFWWFRIWSRRVFDKR